MKDKAIAAASILALMLFCVWNAVTEASQDAGVGQSKEEVSSRISCVVCKIVSLVLSIALFFLTLATPLVALLGLFILLLCWDKYQKSKDNPSAQRQAKRTAKIMIAVMGIFVAAVIVLWILALTGMIGGDCGNICYPV